MTDEAPARERLHTVVRGRVQGVWFRDFTRRHAEALGLTGWVRNLPDGTVELAAEGPRPELEALLRHVRTGPPRARVDAVDVEWLPARGEDSGFEIR